uniref:Apolipoprotein L n=1 Tax=Seriola dumerili TaxID=41447 RepID=A0A3B4VMZ8_SERDU
MASVRGFCETVSKWVLAREEESKMIKDIKDRFDKTDLSLSHVAKSQEKGKAFLEYMDSMVKGKQTCEELEKELAAVLEDTLGGLEKLDCFLDAVEKLAVTSLHVFMENQVLVLPGMITLENIQAVIAAARLICPLLLEFKRDARVFFTPRLQNAEVLSYQLDRYIQTIQIICEQFEKSSLWDFCLKKTMETLIDLDEDLSEDETQRMLYHINQLDEIRMNQHFRTAFLFPEESCSAFISEFNKRHPRMLQCLKDLEDIAVQLDKMSKGAKISSVAGSSVGAVGGVLSIVGLALIPVTAGVSLALTMTGVGLGITSGVNSAATAATEVGVNVAQQKKTSEVFEVFNEDVQSLQDCLEEVTSQTVSKIKASVIDVAQGVGKVLSKVCAVGKGIDSLVDAASAAKVLQSEEVITGVGKMVAQEGKALRNVPRVASDIPDIGQAAVKGPLGISNPARAGFIGINALFLGMDIFFICKDSIGLAKGSETKVSKFIRARAALLSSEIESWKKIRGSLCQSLLTSERKRGTLETPFYP